MEQEQAQPELNKKKRWYKNRRWQVILALVLVILLGFVGWLVFANNDDDQTQNIASSAQKQESNLEITIPDAIDPIDETKIPLGDGKISTSAKSGYVYSCQTSFNGGGASDSNSWINTVNNTWNLKKKVSVSGKVEWPNASYKVSVSENTRKITGNNLPINGQTTGVYPVQQDDPAYRYDRNPNEISEQDISMSLPAKPKKAGSPTCTSLGAIGILTDGVVLFNALDAGGRDAAAYETLDSCDGHPEMTDEYHHHGVPSCILSKYNKVSTSTLVGYANDGFGIYIERDKNGDLLTNKNLDECHGRTSVVEWDGKLVEMYHYVATLEYPYVVGCFRGEPQVSQQSQNSTQTGQPVAPPRR